MAVDIQKLLNEELPAALAKNADAARKIGAKYQINITGDGGGEWYIDVSDSGPKAEKGNPGTADCTITLSVEDFHKLHENPQANGMQLYFAGKLKVTGNQMLAMKLQQLFSIAPTAAS
jgi:putative sterol carrier protein